MSAPYSGVRASLELAVVLVILAGTAAVVVDGPLPVREMWERAHEQPLEAPGARDALPAVAPGLPAATGPLDFVRQRAVQRRRVALTYERQRLEAVRTELAAARFAADAAAARLEPLEEELAETLAAPAATVGELARREREVEQGKQAVIDANHVRNAARRDARELEALLSRRRLRVHRLERQLEILADGRLPR